MSTVMPRTAEGAHAVARQYYRAMLHHADAGRDNMASTAAGCFYNAAMLAQMYELRNIRIALMRLAGPNRQVLNITTPMDDLDSHEWHPAVPDVPHDGYHPAGVR